MRIFISAGEPSGDLHAANLIRSIRRRLPDAEFVGYGGAKMEGAGARLLYPLVDLAVMWFLNVLLNLLTFIRLIFKADRYFRDERPDAVVLIDYPGLHWWIARRAKARGIPVFYFVPPQLWAWAGWRVKKVQKYVDQVLCSLPFEPAWYHERGVPDAVYVGHPYFDELADRPLDDGFLSEHRGRLGPLVAILPGSRTQEVKRNLPDMIAAARELARRRPDVRFAVACLHDRHKALAERIIGSIGASGEWQVASEDEVRSGPATCHLPLATKIEVFAARTPELIRLARLAWAVSGSVGLELMADGLPSVVLYKVKRFDLWVARPFIKAKYISLVNLLANEEVFPEYLTWRDASGDLVRWCWPGSTTRRSAPDDGRAGRAAASGRPPRRHRPRRRADRRPADAPCRAVAGDRARFPVSLPRPARSRRPSARVRRGRASTSLSPPGLCVWSRAAPAGWAAHTPHSPHSPHENLLWSSVEYGGRRTTGGGQVACRWSPSSNDGSTPTSTDGGHHADAPYFPYFPYFPRFLCAKYGAKYGRSTDKRLAVGCCKHHWSHASISCSRLSDDLPCAPCLSCLSRTTHRGLATSMGADAGIGSVERLAELRSGQRVMAR